MTDLPFTLAEFRAAPLRVRSAATPDLRPKAAKEALGMIVVHWEGMVEPWVYKRGEYQRLRLAPLTRIVKCRAYHLQDGRVCFASWNTTNLYDKRERDGWLEIRSAVVNSDGSVDVEVPV